MKKLFVSMFLTMAAWLVSYAALPVGHWKIYDNFSFEVNSVIDTPHKVYYVTDGNLYSYDKQNDETTGYNRGTGLSDVQVSDIHYNTEKGYLLVFYVSGNIDVIYDDGRIVNMPDISEARNVSNRTLNDADFSGDTAYVGTGFGVVTFDMNRHCVIESGIYNKNVAGITVVGDKLLIVADNQVSWLPLSSRLNSYDNFTPIGTWENTQYIQTIGPDKVVAGYNHGGNFILDIDFENGRFTADETYLYGIGKPTRAGDRMMIADWSAYKFYDTEGRSDRHYVIPDEFKMPGMELQVRVSTSDPSRGLWYLTPDGLGHCDTEYNIDRSPARPQATTMHKGIGSIRTGKASPGTVYVMNRSNSRGAAINNQHGYLSVNTLDDGWVTDITPSTTDVEILNINSENRIKPGFTLTEDNTDPGTVYVGTWFEGIYKIKDGKQIAKYDWRNMPLDLDYILGCADVAMDTRGNLWVYAFNARNDRFIGVLPASKVKVDNVTKSDWVPLSTPDFGTYDTRDACILPLTRTQDMVLISDGHIPNNLLVYHYNGTADTNTDDRWYKWSEFTDQDGRSVGPVAVFDMAEDHDGAVWLATAGGVLVIHRPASMLDGSGTVERVKVPRNDGTVYADYLLDNQKVTGVAVDAANRKWLSTSASGVYLVSPDGKEILAHYTVDNSPLPTNEIACIECGTDDNKVYMGTRYGLVEYSSDAAPAAADYSDIYAYPNPVRPGYRGPITVTGLMDDSLVKIADTAGNVLFQGRSNGGMITWDGCDAGGNRVATGVYLVLVSSGSGSSSAAATKIMVVN